MSILTASAAPLQMTVTASTSNAAAANGIASSTTATALQKLEEEKNKVHLVMTLAERYGGRAIQRTASGSEEGEQENQASTSPSSFQPFSSTWAARYWQLQKLKAEQALAELEQRSRENEV